MGEAATLATVWTDVSTFFTTALSSGISVITSHPILVAPTVIGVSGIVIGSAKRLIRVGGRRR